MKYTFKNHPLHGQLKLYGSQIYIIHHTLVFSNLAGITLEWKVLDTRCSDSKLNSIDKPCSFKNNTTFVKYNKCFFNSDYSIYTLNRSEITKTAASHATLI